MVKTVVIAGSGFSGLETALRLRNLQPHLRIIVIDKKAVFTYSPSLHELACGYSSRSRIVFNLEGLYKKHNIKFYKEEIVQVQPLQRTITTITRKITFDFLVLATGSVMNYYGIDGLEENSFKLRTALDAKKINTNLKHELEKAKHYSDPVNVVVAGAGITGVELAGVLSEKVKKRGKVILLEGNSEILSGFNKEVVDASDDILSQKRVDIRCDSAVSQVQKGRISIKEKGDIHTSMIIWCGGIKPNPLNHKCGLRTSETGGIMVNEFLETGHPLIYAIGDCSYSYRKPQPATAQIAIAQGRLVAENIDADIQKQEKKAFSVDGYSYLISLGRFNALFIQKQSLQKGLYPALIKKLVERIYIFQRRNWVWPFKRFDFK